MSNRRNPSRGGEKARVVINNNDVGKVRAIKPEHRSQEKNSMRRIIEEWDEDNCPESGSIER